MVSDPTTAFRFSPICTSAFLPTVIWLSPPTVVLLPSLTDSDAPPVVTRATPSLLYVNSDTCTLVECANTSARSAAWS